MECAQGMCVVTWVMPLRTIVITWVCVMPVHGDVRDMYSKSVDINWRTNNSVL